MKKYDALWKNEWKHLHKIGPSVRSRNRILLRLFGRYIDKGSILDAGCGDGTFLIMLKKKYGCSLKYDASDFSKEALAQLPDFIRSKYHTDLTKKSTFPNRKYRAVIASEVLEHITEWKLALSNIAGVVMQHGLVFITVPHGKDYWGRHDDFADHKQRFEKGEIESELKRLGFEIKESICWGWPIYWLYYSFYLNRTDPKKAMSGKGTALKKIASDMLFNLFRVDDLFNTTKGRRLFIVARKL